MRFLRLAEAEGDRGDFRGMARSLDEYIGEAKIAPDPSRTPAEGTGFRVTCRPGGLAPTNCQQLESRDRPLKNDSARSRR
jgi:hypothetical protein